MQCCSLSVSNKAPIYCCIVILSCSVQNTMNYSKSFPEQYVFAAWNSWNDDCNKGEQNDIRTRFRGSVGLKCALSLCSLVSINKWIFGQLLSLWSILKMDGACHLFQSWDCSLATVAYWNKNAYGCGYISLPVCRQLLLTHWNQI